MRIVAQRIWAIVKFEMEGTHWYPKASGHERFLSNAHRHVFHVEVHVEQKHDDRDVEYIKLKRWLQKMFPNGREGTFSCEQLAKEVIAVMRAHHKGREVKVYVTEDGENGCLVE